MTFVMERECFKHRGGTKEYEVIALRNSENNASLIIKRWGKVSSFGQVDFSLYSEDDPACLKQFNEIRETRLKNGYDSVGKFDWRCAEVTGLQSEMSKFLVSPKPEFKEAWGIFVGDKNGVIETESTKPKGPVVAASAAIAGWGEW